MQPGRNILPTICDKPLDEITRKDCAGIEQTLESRGAFNIAGKVCDWISIILSMATAQGKCELNPASEHNATGNSTSQLPSPFRK
ncbi:phage integrase central domain-containing protein [Larsenimonas rhizosphaerae]|uniref:phage integrase central domain-containing protein n=1 Tax=Larsenimonas rhizosphaerae TaxID=2944682 RepID=UPI003898E4E1